MDRRWFALDSGRAGAGAAQPRPCAANTAPASGVPCPERRAQAPLRAAPRREPGPGPAAPHTSSPSRPAARTAKDTLPPLPGASRRIARYRVRRVRAGSAAANLPPGRLLPWTDRGRPARTAAGG